MEHIVQFAISMDDEAITKSVKANAEKVIIHNLENQIRAELFDLERYAYTNDGKRKIIGPSEWSKLCFNEFLDAHKDEIVKEAAKHLADKMSRTKAVKEAVAQAVKGE